MLCAGPWSFLFILVSLKGLFFSLNYRWLNWTFIFNCICCLGFPLWGYRPRARADHYLLLRTTTIQWDAAIIHPPSGLWFLKLFKEKIKKIRGFGILGRWLFKRGKRILPKNHVNLVRKIMPVVLVNERYLEIFE